MAHKALGRGLDALFSASKTVGKEPLSEVNREGEVATEVREIQVHQIKPNRHQPRVTFDPAGLEELAQSIRTHGVTQPLVVTETPSAGEYELVVGERRLRASKLAGLATVPCLIKKLTNRERFEIALIENLQRQDLNGLEEALALDGLMREYNLTQEQVAEVLGKSRSSVANTLRFLKLHENVQAALRSSQISEGHAKCLAGISEHAEQLRLLEKVIAENLSVRDLEALLIDKKPKKKSPSAGPAALTPSSPEVKKFEEDFQRILGRRVEIQTQGKKGWIRFAFYSPWDLELLCKKLGLLDQVTGEPKI